MNEELKKELMMATADADKYLTPPAGKGIKMTLEVLAEIASEETLRQWFIESYQLLKKLQADVSGDA